MHVAGESRTDRRLDSDGPVRVLVVHLPQARILRVAVALDSEDRMIVEQVDDVRVGRVVGQSPQRFDRIRHKVGDRRVLGGELHVARFCDLDVDNGTDLAFERSERRPDRR